MDVMALRIWLVKQMLEHRNIGLSTVAEALGCTPRWLRNVVSLEYTMSDTKRVLWLNDIESVITKVSDTKGSIPLACCGSKAYGDYKDLISKGAMAYG